MKVSNELMAARATVIDFLSLDIVILESVVSSIKLPNESFFEVAISSTPLYRKAVKVIGDSCPSSKCSLPSLDEINIE